MANIEQTYDPARACESGTGLPNGARVRRLTLARMATVAALFGTRRAPRPGIAWRHENRGHRWKRAHRHVPDPEVGPRRARGGQRQPRTAVQLRRRSGVAAGASGDR